MAQKAIVINPLLWLSNQRMKLLRQDVLIKLITSHYKAEEINTAKDALFGCFPEEKRPSNLRKKIRQGAQKLESNIKDIIECFSAMAAAENFELPSFVTDNCNFPSLDLKHIDAATLCQDVISLKKEFSKVREDAALISAQVATISEIKESLEDFRSTMKQSLQLRRSNADKDADITFSETGIKELPSMQKTYSTVVANTIKNSDVQNGHKKGFLFKEKSVEDKDVTIFDAESTSWIKVKVKKKKQQSISHNRATTNTYIGKNKLK